MSSLIIYISIFWMAALCLNEGRKYKFHLWGIAGLSLLIIFSAGRYHVGTDCNTYINIFERYVTLSWTEVMEDGDVLFSLIAKLCYTIGGRVLTWGVFAALILLPIYMTIKREYPDLYAFPAFFSFLALYYAVSFNVTRQFVAVALVVWGMKYVFENKFIRFAIVVLVATGFHTSAPIALMIWFLWDHKRNMSIRGFKKVVFFIIITLIVFKYQDVINYVTSNISTLESYSSYAEESSRGKNRDIYFHIFELSALLLLKTRMNIDDERIEVMYSMLIISVLIGFTGFSHPQVKRLAYYYSVPATIVLFGYAPYGFTKNSRTIASLLMCIYAIAYFTLTAYILGQANLIPYRFDLFSAW